MHNLPVIDISPLISGEHNGQAIGDQIREACTSSGFFYIQGHGVSTDLQSALEGYSKQFFAQDLSDKMKIRMSLGGRAWRGFFPIGDELTSGKPDQKEGLYFGAELDDNDPRVNAGLLLHGKNLFPSQAGFKQTVLAYMAAMTDLGHHLMRGLALSLHLPGDFFRNHYTDEPLTLFRIFHYPPLTTKALEQAQWSVGEHTDYGVLTMLKQDEVGGLQVKSQGQWLSVPFIPNSFVCNIGDMLERLTGGYYRSTPHRVLNASGLDRYSYPFFFDPNFDAAIRPVPSPLIPEQEKGLHDSETYGDYIQKKIAHVFPDLDRDVREQDHR